MSPRGGESTAFGPEKDCILETSTQDTRYTAEGERINMTQDGPGHPSVKLCQRVDISLPQEAASAKLDPLVGRRGSGRHEKLTVSTDEHCDSSLTMDVIGCLPDNVQQVRSN